MVRWFQTHLANALSINKSSIRNHCGLEFFDRIVTDPPFGSKMPIQNKGISERYELGRIWNCDKFTNTWTMTDRLQGSAPPEILFIERCVQLLKPGGRIGVVLRDSILGSPGLSCIRERLIRNHRIVASVDLDVATFQLRKGAQTSVLVPQKKSATEKKRDEDFGITDRSIFVAIVGKVGHDKRGNSMSKRGTLGNEILVGEATADENGVQSTRKVKTYDDQTVEVAQRSFVRGNIAC